MIRLLHIESFALVLSSCGFSGALDSLGREEAVTETARNAEVIEDDRIEDKHPEFDPSRMVIERFGDYCAVGLNKSGSVTKLDIVSLSDENADLKDKIFSSRQEAADAVGTRLDDKHSLIPSIETVNGALKPFNDGLYAAVETGVELGATDAGGGESYASKRQFLHDLLAAVIAMRDASDVGKAYFDTAAADLGAALILSGETPVLPENIKTDALNLVAKFEAEPIYSKPIGFYTWTDTLEQVFKQDRFLQNYQAEELDTPYTDEEMGKAAALALVVDSDESLTARYESYLALYAGLTNPFANHPVTLLLPYLSGTNSLADITAVTSAFLADYPPPDLESACQPHFALFPSSTSKETEYFENKFCTGAPVGANINYMDELILAIRNGLIDLAPTADSGWYDYQSFALETLLAPEKGSESDHLLLTAAYKKKLIETFKSLITQNRETHVKQLEMGMGKVFAAPPDTTVDIYPNFSVEPFPTFYLRSARAYRFLNTYLEAVLGNAFMTGAHRMNENGTDASLSLKDELVEKAKLLYGLHFLTADNVGMAPELLDEELAEFAEPECRATAEIWMKNWLDDEDINRDSRVIVPVQREDYETIYWATLGTRVIEAGTEFYKGYEPKVVPISYEDIPSTWGDEIWTCEVKDIISHNYYLLVDTFAEVRLPSEIPPPTRDELRAILDQYDNAKDMVNALESL
jgi:hypothetical protein